MQRRSGRLAYKFLFWFLLISLGPMIVVGTQFISLSRDSLKKESLRLELNMAVGFAATVRRYVLTFKNVLIEQTQNMEEFGSMNPARLQAFLGRIMQLHAAFLELSVLNKEGMEVVRLGRFLGGTPELRDFKDHPFYRETIRRGEFYSEPEKFQGLYPTINIAVSIVDPRSPSRQSPMGVLLGKLSLNALSQMLQQQFPEKGRNQAAVVAPDGFLIAHSELNEVFKPDASLPKEILKVILTQPSKQGGGEISIGDKERVLGAYAEVEDLGWMVYVQQPMENLQETASEMQARILRVLVWVIGATVILSLAVSGHVSHPIRVLNAAADRLSRGEFEGMPEPVMTNDEIGELAQTFVQMSESLKEKTGELMHAKEELEKFTKFLEKRVEARTRELKAAQDELIKKERLAAIGQMASVVGHEIRNPLAVINNSIYYVKTKLGTVGELDPKIAKHVAIIESEIQQANGIINEILGFARTRDLKPEVMALNGFLEELLQVYPLPSHVRVLKEFAAENPLVFIDMDEMRQAIRNLVGNGVEVMPQGGVLKVATELVHDDWVRLSITDAGPGIPRDVLDKIFTPFFTTKARGTGLGLAVVRKVVDRHKGKVDVATELGKGTTFRIFLPLASRQQLPSPQHAPK